MKKLATYIVLFISLLITHTTHAKNQTITVTELSKNCETLLEVNIIDYQMCKDWQLDKQAVKTIIAYSKEADMYNPTRDLTPLDTRVAYKGKVTIDNEPYEISIYSTSWYSLYPLSGETTAQEAIEKEEEEKIKYYSCTHKACQKYFLGNYISEGMISKLPDDKADAIESKLRKKFNENRKNTLIKVTPLQAEINNHWIGVYPLNDYTVKITKGFCHINDLKNKKYHPCSHFEVNGKLYVYNQLLGNHNKKFFYKNKNVPFQDAEYMLSLDENKQIHLSYKLDQLFNH